MGRKTCRKYMINAVQIQCVNYVPSNEFRMKYQQIITDLHGSNSDECLIYGIPVVAEVRHHFKIFLQSLISERWIRFVDTVLLWRLSVLHSQLHFILFQRFQGYSMKNTEIDCLFCKIRVKLRSLGNISSSKTAQMQKRFFLTQIAQVKMEKSRQKQKILNCSRFFFLS